MLIIFLFFILFVLFAIIISHYLIDTLFFHCYNHHISNTKRGNHLSSPQTINGLMRHLRNDCNISISGSYQKQQLISYGYYHGYKGYCPSVDRKLRNEFPSVMLSPLSTVFANSSISGCRGKYD